MQKLRKVEAKTSLLVMLAVLFMLAIAAGCSTTTVPAGDGNPTAVPNDAADRMAQAITVLTQVRIQTAHLLKVKRLSIEDARAIQSRCDTAREFLDAAKAAFVDNPASNLDKVNTLLSSVSTLLMVAQQDMEGKQRRP